MKIFITFAITCLTRVLLSPFVRGVGKRFARHGLAYKFLRNTILGIALPVRFRTHRLYVFPFDFGSGASLFLKKDRRGWEEKGFGDFWGKFVKPGMVVVDIGSHVGTHAIEFARMVGLSGQVYAFEPCPYTYSLLTRNIQINGYANITVSKFAISDQSARARLYLALSSEGHSLVVKSSNYMEIDTITLDEFFADKNHYVDFIRMNIEGGEPKALDGMQKIIAKNSQLTIVSEYNPHDLYEAGCPPEQFFKKIRGLGFRIYCSDSTGTFHHILEADLPERFLNELGLAYVFLKRSELPS